MGRIFRRFKLPMVVGYLAAGMILGPSLGRVVSLEMNQALN